MDIKKIIVFALIIIAISLNISQGVVIANGPTNSQEFLLNKFNDSIEVDKDKKIIEYCPDNTCESFRFKNNPPKDVLYNFMFLSLYYASDYFYLEKFKQENHEKLIRQIVEKERKNLNIVGKAEYNLEDEVKKVVRELIKQYSISFSFVRYDEKNRNVVPSDIFEYWGIAK